MATRPVGADIIEQRPDRTGATAEGLPRPRYHGSYPDMLKSALSRIWDGFGDVLRRTDGWVRRRTRPPRSDVLLTVADLFRSRQELIAENALLRTQLVVLDSHVTRPKFKPRDRALMVLLSRFARSWRDAVLIIKPETVLGWHRYGFRSALFSRYLRHFHEVRPHQGIGQRVPAGAPQFADKDGPIVSSPILGGLHHEYRRVA